MVRPSVGRSAALSLFCCMFVAVCGSSTSGIAPATVPTVPSDPSLPCHVAADPSADILLPMSRVSQSIPYAHDGDSDLCWAASMAMVSDYLGKPVALCQVAQQRSYGVFVDCCQPVGRMDEMSIMLCNRGASSSEIDLAFDRLGIQYRHVAAPLSEQDLLQELAHGRPVYMDRENGDVELWYGMEIHGRHAVVIMGHVDGRYVVLDPSPFSSGPEHETYSQLRYGYSGDRRWRESWYRLSLRRDGCAPTFVPGCSCEAP